MKRSRRSQRMGRHYARMHRAGGLNLVSLMDIFTILVFFLMVNSSDVKVMQQSSDVSLPLSTSDKPSRETLLVEVIGDAIIVQGRQVATLDDVSADGKHIPGLSEELEYRRERRQTIPEQGLKVTVMADKSTEYRLLRRIMQTAVDVDYRQVRLAVEKQTDDASPPGGGNG